MANGKYRSMTSPESRRGRPVWIRRVDSVLAAQPTTLILLMAVLAMAAVVTIDLVTGGEVSVSIFFLIPVGFTAWYTTRRFTALVAITSAVLWFVADRLAGASYSNEFIPIWNASVRLGFFLIVAALLFGLRASLRRQESLARHDHLTGLANLRHFSAMAAQEIYRASRYQHPLSVAYLDLDDFKSVNDRFGHQKGDQLLRAVATAIAGEVRLSDTVARLGGDEFALLMPETGQDAALAVLAKLQDRLAAAEISDDFGITLSMGCVTYPDPPDSVDELIKDADSLMYEAKRAGKNRVATKLYASRQRSIP